MHSRDYIHGTYTPVLGIVPSLAMKCAFAISHILSNVDAHSSTPPSLFPSLLSPPFITFEKPSTCHRFFVGSKDRGNI